MLQLLQTVLPFESLSASVVTKLSKKIPGLLGACVVAALSFSAGPLQAAEELRYFHLLSGDAAGSGFEMAASLASAISGPPGAPSCNADSRCGVPGLIGVAQSSAGPLDSLGLLADGLADAALVRASLLAHAQDQHQGKIGKHGRLSDLRHVSNIGTHELHVFTARDLKLTKLSQLRHYRIGVGSPRSEVPMIARAMFGAAGMNAGAMQLKPMSDAEAAEKLKTDQLDAFVYVGNDTTRVVSDLLREGAVDDLQIGDDVLDKLAQELTGAYTINVPSRYVAGEWVERLAFPVSLVVHRGAGAHFISAVLASVWWQGNQDLLLEGGLGPLLHARTFEMMQVPLHEGAAIYFRENGGVPRGIAPAP